MSAVSRKTPSESIYNLITKAAVAEKKSPRYVSKFRNQVKEEKKGKYSSHRTMGYAQVPLNPPTEFLKKQHPCRPQKQQPSSSQPAQSSCLQQQRRPQVPRRSEKPVMGVKSKKNFVSGNITANITSVPKQPTHKFVDTPSGSAQLLQPSGLVPKYIKKKDFAKTPPYLAKMKAEQTRKELEYSEYVRQQQERGAIKALTEEERSQLLQGLKRNWEELHHAYQGLSVITDSAPKKNRKEWLETQLKNIEKDIETVEKYKIIYIAEK